MSVIIKDIDCTGRIIIVGDIHGCFDEFMALLKKVKYRKYEDTLILVGDLINKGPKSIDVIRYCCRNNILAVKGNNEENILHKIRKNKIPYIFRWAKRLTNEEISYMQNMPHVIRHKDQGFIVVHAGIDPSKSIEEQLPNNLLYMRNMINDRPTRSDKEGTPWINSYSYDKINDYHVYFGHDAYKGLQQTECATGLDTGCVYGGDLTCAILPENRIVSVRAYRDYTE